VAQKVRAGAPQTVELHAAEAGQKKLNSFAVAITENQASTIAWEVRVEALLYERAATRELGRVTVVPPSVSRVPSRIVAMGCCPGCRGFRVTVSGADPGSGAPNECLVEIGLCEYLLEGDPGLVANEPHAVRHGDRYSYLAANIVADTNVQVPSNQRILTVSALSLGVGATMAVGTNPAINLERDVAVQVAPNGNLRGPLTVAFAGVPVQGLDYIVELGT